MARYIRVGQALSLADEAISLLNIPDRKHDYMEFVFSGSKKVVHNAEIYIELESIKEFLDNFRKWIEEKDSSLLRRNRGFKVDKVPDVIEFVESKEFMGMKGSVFPVVKDALWDIWHTPNKKYVEIIMTGSIGTGKSFMSEMCIAYMVYRLSLLHDPQAELDLAPGSPLFIALQAGTMMQASNILFRPLYNRMALSPYFTQTFPFNKDIRSELIFPNNITIRPFTGSDDAVLGLTVVGGAVTELNRMAYIKRSRKSRVKSAQDQIYDQAVAIYTTLIRRMVSRTMQLGKLWGMLILDAAHEHEEDFTSGKIREAKTNPSIYVYKKAQWEAVPKLEGTGETFLVEVGTETRRSRLITTREEAIEQEKVIEIPIEYYQWFEQDVEGSLRDFGGIVIGVQQPAIPFREKIGAAVEAHVMISGGSSIFYRQDAVLQDYRDVHGDDRWPELVNHAYIDEVLIDKKAEFVAHLDPALKHDSMGIAIGHIVGWSLLPPVKRYNFRRRIYEDKHDIKAPIHMLDGILRVFAPYGEEIDLEMAQRLILYLAQTINLTTVSIDSYQSAQMIQAWRTANLITGNVSVDNSLDPYTRLKIAYRDGRMMTPRHEVYLKEITELQFDGAKYDHFEGASKDCSDAVAGVVFLLETQIADYSPVTPMQKPDEQEERRTRRTRSFTGRRLGLPSRFAR